jgi:hypothetical protein
LIPNARKSDVGKETFVIRHNKNAMGRLEIEKNEFSAGEADRCKKRRGRKDNLRESNSIGRSDVRKRFAKKEGEH